MASQRPYICRCKRSEAEMTVTWQISCTFRHSLALHSAADYKQAHIHMQSQIKITTQHNASSSNRSIILPHPPPPWQRFRDHRFRANVSSNPTLQQRLSAVRAESPCASHFASTTCRRNYATQSTVWCQTAMLCSTSSTNYRHQLKLSAKSLAQSVPSP
jgi:hypothetical protein